MFPHLKEKKKICESPRSDPIVNTASDEGKDDQVLKALNMTERIASQLKRICQTLASVGNRLQGLEGIFERCSVLEMSINSLQTGQSTLSEKSRIIEKKTNYIEMAMEFENAEFEGLKKTKTKWMKIKSKSLKINCCTKRYTIEEKICFFFWIPESTTESSPNWQEEDGRGQASDRSFLAISRTWAGF